MKEREWLGSPNELNNNNNKKALCPILSRITMRADIIAALCFQRQNKPEHMSFDCILSLRYFEGA
jgi:hypothetical protein